MSRLVLFDIDETMIKSDGAGGRAIRQALSKTFGITQEFGFVNMSGKTDPQICHEILLAAGITTGEITMKLPGALDLYSTYLPEEIAKSQNYRLHEGVIELLEILPSQDSVYVGLLTGNIEKGARIKLEPFKLNSHFGIGAFGSDSADRMDLPAIARRRAKEYFGVDFEPQDLVIIGDAINDIKCAKGFGAISIAVNTGKTSWDELSAQSPDFLFPSLRQTPELVDAILLAQRRL